MELSITYNELESLIFQPYGANVMLSPCIGQSGKEGLLVSYKPSRFLPDIKIRIWVEDIKDTSDIELSFDMGTFVSCLILNRHVNRFVSQIGEQYADVIELDIEKHVVVIHAAKIKGLEKAFEHATLDEIRFDEVAVRARASFNR